MWQFVIGFGAGVYVGTYFDCKPTIEKITSVVKDYCPPKMIPEKKGGVKNETAPGSK